MGASRAARWSTGLWIAISVGCEPANPLDSGQPSFVAPASAVAPAAPSETVTILDALGAATTSTHFSVFGTGSNAVIFSSQLAGPEFVLSEPMIVTEIGAFLNNCETIISGVPHCPGTLPLTVHIRPSVNGLPDPAVVLASFVLSHDDNPLVISYESVIPDVTLDAGRYFALFAAQGSDVGFLLSNATDPFQYEAGIVTLGLVFPFSGTSAVAPNSRNAVRILGRAAHGGAVVSNSGNGKSDVSCAFDQFTTTQGTAVRSSSGNAILSCHFSNLPLIANQQSVTGWLCTITQGGVSETRESHWVRSPSGSASLTCRFNGKSR